MSISLSFVRPLVMGIVNVTPDSFSGDGLMVHYDYIAAAAQQAMSMVEEGADILDIGGESSRPGAALISSDEEISRVIPVIRELRRRGVTTPLAVDTIKASVAKEALAAGADIINDISALSHDEAMAGVVAEAKAWVVLMHNRTEIDAFVLDKKLGGEYQASIYGDVVADVKHDLLARISVAKNAGIKDDRIILDPGIGFGKTMKQNLDLINRLDQLVAMKYPLMLGTSRKGFIGRVLNTTVEDRVEGTAASVAIGVLRGAKILRVHDVKFMARIIAMTDAILTAGERT